MRIKNFAVSGLDFFLCVGVKCYQTLTQTLKTENEIENGKVYIRPDTEPIVSLKTSIFTSRHLSYNSTD